MEGAMADLRRAWERDARARRQNVEQSAAAFRRVLQATWTRAEENIDHGEKLVNTKMCLKELEEDLREALVVKSRKDAKNTTISASLSAAKVQTEDFRKTLEAYKSKRAEYESIISSAMEELNRDNSKDDDDIEATEEGILWYKKVLGFRIEGGEGVKFVFDKIDSEDPDMEYTFTIRLNNDTYTMLQCCPTVPDVKVLLDEVNQTNGLYKFVRAMRKKFQEAAKNGILWKISDSARPEMSVVSVSSPPLASADDSKSETSSLHINSEVASPHKERSSVKEAKRSSSNRRTSQSKLNEALRRSPRRKANQLL
ncbi:kinetochore protein [Wolffia australiana]